MGEGRVLTRPRCCVSLEPQQQQQQLPGATDDEMLLHRALLQAARCRNHCGPHLSAPSHGVYGCVCHTACLGVCGRERGCGGGERLGPLPVKCKQT